MKLDRELFERAAKAFRDGDEQALLEIASRNVKERARLAAAKARKSVDRKDEALSSVPDGEGR